MGKRRNALAAVIRQELAVARGTARAVLAAAEEASAEAERQRQATEESFPACIGQLTAEREVVRTDILRRYRHVVVPEMNLGQLCRVLRAEYLVDAKAITKVQGAPFTALELEEAYASVLSDATEEESGR